MSRVHVFALAVFTTLVCVGCATPGAHPPLGSPSVVPSFGLGSDDAWEDNLPILRMLEKRVPEVLMESTLDQVIEFLRDSCQTRILVDWKALSEKGVEGDVPVGLPRRTIRLRDFLEAALADACEDGDLTYDVQDGLIVVSTRAKLWRRMTLRICDVRALLSEARRWHSAMPDEMRDAHTNCLCCPTRACAEAELAGVIRQTVAPDLWRANAGGPATIEIFNGMMVVRQNNVAHWEIQRLLAALHRPGG
jgi:hypothetical protein